MPQLPAAVPETMSRWWYLARRVAWTVVAAWLLLSGTFLVYAYTPDPNRALVGFGAAQAAAMQGENATAAAQQALAAYDEARNYDEPLLERYTRWVVGYATGNWGESFTHREPVIDVIADRAPFTLVYVIPGIVIAVLLGVLLGLLAATSRSTLADYVVTVVAYSGLGIPAFVLGDLLLVLALREFAWYGVLYDSRSGLFTARNLTSMALPAFVVGANVFAVQVRYARAESLDHVASDFVKRLRASGGGTATTARHVLRNAALPLVSLFFTETLTVLFVTIYVVEVVFQVPGLGKLAYDAIEARDIGVILATTMLPVFVGVFGNLVQDVAYTLLDPRVDYDDR